MTRQRLNDSAKGVAAALIPLASIVAQEGTGKLFGVPFLVVWAPLSLVLAGGWLVIARWRTHLNQPVTSVSVAAMALALWLVADVPLLTQLSGLYDLQVLRNAGYRFLSGENPYLTSIVTHVPPDTGPGPFLYAPVVLPAAALVSRVPMEIIGPVWAAGLLAAGWLAFRALGMRGAWPWLFLAFPPLLKGVQSGNLTNVLFLVLAYGVWRPMLLPSAGLVKLQAGLPGLWPIRERRWRDAALGVALMGLLVVVTLPATGLSAWADWVGSLDLYRRSAEGLPILYGLSLAQLMPFAAFVGLSVAAVAAALLLSGRRGLAALGVASVIASPSLWPHGLLIALPAVLSLEVPFFWVAVGVVSGGPVLWILPMMAAVAVVRQWDRSTLASPHPLAGTLGPWTRQETN